MSRVCGTPAAVPFHTPSSAAPPNARVARTLPSTTRRLNLSWSPGFSASAAAGAAAVPASAGALLSSAGGVGAVSCWVWPLTLSELESIGIATSKV